jgi:hypothetical protein
MGYPLDRLPGAIAGENIAIEYRFANGELERLLALAAVLVQLGGTLSSPGPIRARLRP